MPEIKTEQEPSIEEILESIRQIISEDGETQPAPAAVANDPVVLQPADTSSLTLKGEPEPVAEEEIILELAEIEEPGDKGRDLDLTPAEAEILKGETTLMANSDEIQDRGGEIELAPVASEEEKGGEALLSQPTAAAASAEISKLLATNIAIEREEAGRIGSVTLEDMARDLMRPLIKSWLDQNLPKLIEKAVAKEIEKLSRRVAGE